MEKQEYAQEQINLMDYIMVLFKRKLLILTVFSLAVAVSLLHNFSPAPKIYETYTTIQLGSINGPLIKNEEVRETILNLTFLRSIIKELNLNMNEETLKNNILITDIINTNLIMIKIVNPDPDALLKINDSIAQTFILQGQKIYEEQLLLTKERLKELDEEVKASQIHMDNIQKLMPHPSDSDTPPSSELSVNLIFLQNSFPSYEKNLSDLREKRNQLKTSLSNIKEFKIFDKPLKPKCLPRPDKKKKIITAGILGLIFGIFLALFIESFQKYKINE